MNEQSKISETLSPRRRGQLRVDRVNLSHGGGGKAMRDLIDDVFVSAFDNPLLAPLEDQGRVSMQELTSLGDRLALTTDSYVVDPLFFPGGNIGKLAVCGTVNDLAVGGAKPLYLTSSFIIEEGVEIELLRSIVASMAEEAKTAGVQIITGDTKVVNKGGCDKVFINTAGVGVIRKDLSLSASNASPGDVVIVNGWLGDHGATILAARDDMALSTSIESDCASLNGLIEDLLTDGSSIKFMRDATRGGLATLLNEVAEASGVSIDISEDKTPIRDEVKGFCEILGLDPLYLANEGKLVIIAPSDEADKIIAKLHQHPLGEGATIIGEVGDWDKGRVTMRTTFGGRRIVDMLVGEQLPRIC